MVGLSPSHMRSQLIALGMIDEKRAIADLQDVFTDALRHHQIGHLADSERLYRRILVVDPRHADTLQLLGVLAHQVGRNDIAVQMIGHAIGINYGEATYYTNLGPALKCLGRLADAVTSYSAAIRLKPDLAEAYSNLGGVLTDLGRIAEAVAACRAALRIKPDYAEAYSNLGLALKELGRLDQAVTAFGIAVGINPDYAEAYSNLGISLTDLGCLDASIRAYRAALRLKPDFAEAHYNESLSLFLLGDLSAAWSKYEWRWRGGGRQQKPRGFSQPQWQGEDIVGRTILLHAEQGLGDSILFSRYVKLVAARGGRVVLEAPRSLLRLLSGLAGADSLVAVGDPLPDFDCHCPLISLPGVFGTTLENIPCTVPYLFAESEARQRWQRRINPSGFRVGIAWQGNPTYKDDRKRSVPVCCFAPLAQIPGVRLISLQKVHGLRQLENLPDGVVIETLGADFDEGADAFIDSAAVMMNLDLIITVDTATAHLAGALGRPVWMALAMVPHWIWMAEGAESPWYPNIRLFRQTASGEWGGVFAQMAAELEAMAVDRT